MAKVTKFRFETLLSIRRNILNEKQGELAKAYEAERILEKKRAEIQGEIVTAIESAREMMRSGGVNLSYLLGMRRHEAYLLAVVADIDGKIVDVRKEIEKRRAAVIEANKEVKILEKLKEKQAEREKKRLETLEMKQMDEIAEVRAARLSRDVG